MPRDNDVMMPIQSGKTLKAIPMALLSERQAYANHGQSLATLASRGGIDCSEAMAIIEGQSQFGKRYIRDNIEVLEVDLLKAVCARFDQVSDDRVRPPK